MMIDFGLVSNIIAHIFAYPTIFPKGTTIYRPERWYNHKWQILHDSLRQTPVVLVASSTTATWLIIRIRAILLKRMKINFTLI